MSAILPLKLRHGKNAANLTRCGILFSSIAAFAEPGLFNEILVVVPSPDRREVELLCQRWPSLPLVVLDEEEYLPILRDRRHIPGQLRQQVIKLHAASYFRAPFFLTLDADVILCKRLRRSDLFLGTRALLEPCPRDIHPLWWKGAGRLLGLSADLSAPGMSVTPAILAKQICERTFARLEQRHGRSWAATLLRLRSLFWTEYTLYYLIGEHYGMLPECHALAGVETQARIFCPSVVWRGSEFDRWKPEDCFDPGTPGFFTVVQSSARIPPETVHRRIAPFLSIAEGSAGPDFLAPHQDRVHLRVR